MTDIKTWKALKADERSCDNCKHGEPLYHGGHECKFNWQLAPTMPEMCGFYTGGPLQQWEWDER